MRQWIMLLVCVTVAMVRADQKIERTYAVREQMKTSGSFAGEWAEVGEGVRMVLRKDGTGVFGIRGLYSPVSWTAKADGYVELTLQFGKRKRKESLSYDIGADSLLLKVGKGTSPLGNKGILRFVTAMKPESSAQSPDQDNWLSLAAPNRLLRARDCEIATEGDVIVTSDLSDCIDVERVIAEGVEIETVDLCYPQVAVSPDPWVDGAVRIDFVYEGDARRRISPELRVWKGRRQLYTYRETDGSDKGNAAADRVETVIKQSGLKGFAYGNQYGTENAAWRECGFLIPCPKGEIKRTKDCLKALLANEKGCPRKIRIIRSEADELWRREHALSSMLARHDEEALANTVVLSKPPPEKRRSPSARPEEDARRIMKENAYCGTWSESIEGRPAIEVSFATNGMAILDIGVRVECTWKSDGKGRITLMPSGRDDGKGQVLAYDPQTDTIDLGFGGKVVDGYSGILGFRSEEPNKHLKDKIEKLRKEEETRLNQMPEAVYARLLEENDPRMVDLVRTEDVPVLKTISEKRLCWKTVDLEYPRIEIRPQYAYEQWINIRIGLGQYASSEKGKVEKSTWKGMDQETIASVVNGIKSADITYRVETEPYDKRMCEDCILVNATPENYAAVDGFIRQCLKGGDLPRKCITEHYATYAEEQEKDQKAEGK